jgi:HSP20 family protein
MEIIPWRPFGELRLLRESVDDLWRRYFENTSMIRTLGGQWIPSVDILETKNSLIIKAELPRLQKEDVIVSISGSVLNIKGEKKREEEEKDEHHHCMERYYGSFQRSFQLPVNVRSDKIEAVFDKGVLKIILPRTDDSTNIEIKVN